MPESILERCPPPADERIRYGDDHLHFTDVRGPAGAGPWPCVIAIHGGFWRNTYNLEHLGALCAALTASGMVTCNVEYRRVGDAGGGWTGTFHDVVAAARFVFDHACELGVDPNRVYVLGHSAGGHLASWLASWESVPEASAIRPMPLSFRGAVSMAGVLDLHQAFSLNLGRGAVAELLDGAPTDVPERYAEASPIALAPSSISHLLIHGEDDSAVPFAMSAAYHEAATKNGAVSTLLRLTDTDHLDVIDPASSIWPVVSGAILDLLSSSAGR